MSFRFGPEHFKHLECCDSFFPGEIAHAANQPLDDHVATLPEVFGVISVKNRDDIAFSKIQHSTDTHRARLWSVEPIETKCDKCGK